MMNQQLIGHQPLPPVMTILAIAPRVIAVDNATTELNLAAPGFIHGLFHWVAIQDRHGMHRAAFRALALRFAERHALNHIVWFYVFIGHVRFSLHEMIFKIHHGRLTP